MAEATVLDDFARELHQQVLQRANLDEEEAFLPDAFLAHVTDALAEEGEIDDAQISRLRLRGLEVGAWSLDPVEGRLDLFTAIHTGTVPCTTVTRDRVDTAFKRMQSFLDKAEGGLYADLEEASPAFDMALQIYELRNSIARVRMFVITDGRTTRDFIPEAEAGQRRISYHVWDIARIERLASSGLTLDPIVVDLESDFDACVTCLPIRSREADYEAYLVLMPGTFLATVYDRYGPRLLESNVRTFLQARGKVNQGIRDTIRSEPSRFFAYNNGLTMTASAVSVSHDGGGTRIRRIEGLQIVNGGQTTASVFTAFTRDPLSVDGIDVAAKLIVALPPLSDELVSNISRYSNTQNRVSQADFSTNNPFHVELEKLSRTVWAPAVDGGQRQTRWFYERARGQYQDRKGRERTPALKRQFGAVHPPSQRFTKTDLAKFEHAWAQLPHLVSRGAQKNYALFFDELGKRNSYLPDEAYFRALVAKAILFRSTEKIVGLEKFGGYRANIVAYTIALLSNLTAQRLDLDEIWRSQRLPMPLDDAIRDLCRLVYPILVQPPGGRNVTEWTKLDKCWEAVREQVQYDLPASLRDLLLPIGKGRQPTGRSGVELVTSEDDAQIRRVEERGADWWLTLSSWAKQTRNLEGWQRGIAYGIGKRIAKGLQPSRKQAAQGVKIIDEADRLGFRVEDVPGVTG